MPPAPGVGWGNLCVGASAADQALWGRAVMAMSEASTSQGSSRRPNSRSATSWQTGDGHYRTYLEGAGQPEGYMSVQQEVTRALVRDGV
jgi:hypothetical protein